MTQKRLPHFKTGSINYYNVINLNHVFLLDSAPISNKVCQFHVRKIRILLIFSWLNDFRKKYQQKNIK